MPLLRVGMNIYYYISGALKASWQSEAAGFCLNTPFSAGIGQKVVSAPDEMEPLCVSVSSDGVTQAAGS